MGENLEWWPSKKLHDNFSKSIASALQKSVDWEIVDCIGEYYYEYITDLLNKRGSDTFLLNEECDELTVGVAVWDENMDDILASNQFPLSEILRNAAFDDEDRLEAILQAAERSIAEARQKGIKPLP